MYVYILPVAHRKVISLNKRELLNLSCNFILMEYPRFVDSIKEVSLLIRVNVLLLH